MALAAAAKDMKSEWCDMWTGEILNSENVYANGGANGNGHEWNVDSGCRSSYMRNASSVHQVRDRDRCAVVPKGMEVLAPALKVIDNIRA